MSKTNIPYCDEACNCVKGRTNSTHGYTLILMGKNKYDYEHRIVMSQVIGRPLKKNEIVHHKNGVKADNRPENLEIVKTVAEHWYKHRKKSSGLRKPNQKNYLIACQCGCGIKLNKFDSSGRPRRFIPGHNTIRKLPKACKCGCGQYVSRPDASYKRGHKLNRFGKRKCDSSALIACACGCERRIDKYDQWGRPRKYISGHNGRRE